LSAEQKTDISRRELMLIDDVRTSGATVETCARALRRAGAAQVPMLVVAWVVEPLRTTI
jgi:predicted amidophosphoribosyltransferase